MITALRDELEAVNTALSRLGGSPWERNLDIFHLEYYRSDLIDSHGTRLYSLVTAAAVDQAQVDTTLRAVSLIQQVRPKVLAMAGICAGARDKVNLGDVIIATRVLDYERGKVVRDPAFENEERILPGAAHFEVCAPWRQAIEDFCKARQNEPAAFKTAFGTIATGSKVIQDANIFQDLRERFHREIIGIDCEAAAIGAVAHRCGIPHWVVAKGVQDHADCDKSDSLRLDAAYRSATILLGFLGERLSDLGLPRSQQRRSPTHKMRPAVAPYGIASEPAILSEAKRLLREWHNEDPLLLNCLGPLTPENKATGRRTTWHAWLAQASARAIADALPRLRPYARTANRERRIAELLAGLRARLIT